MKTKNDEPIAPIILPAPVLFWPPVVHVPVSQTLLPLTQMPVFDLRTIPMIEVEGESDDEPTTPTALSSFSPAFPKK